MKIIRFTDTDSIATPAPELLNQLPDSISKIAAETSDLRERYRAAVRDLTEAEHERDGARLRDNEQAGAALRAKKPAPKATLPKAEEKVTAKAAELEALGVAAVSAGNDLRKAVEAHRAEAEKTLTEEQDQQRARCHETALALAAAVSEGGATGALLSWLRDPHRDPNPGAHAMRQTNLKSMGGQPFTVGALISELTTAWVDEESLPPVLAAQPLQQVPR